MYRILLKAMHTNRWSGLWNKPANANIYCTPHVAVKNASYNGQLESWQLYLTLCANQYDLWEEQASAKESNSWLQKKKKSPSLFWWDTNSVSTYIHIWLQRGGSGYGAILQFIHDFHFQVQLTVGRIAVWTTVNINRLGRGHLKY